MPESQIIIASKYVDLASPEIKKGMAAIRNEVVITAKEFDSFKRSISTHLGLFRKSVREAMEESIKSQKNHTTEVSRHARTMGVEIGKLAGIIGSIRNLILVWMFALRPLITLIKETTQAAMEQEDALKRMTFALEMQGIATDTTKEYLIDLSKEFQRTTRYSDEAIMKLMDSAMVMGNIMPYEIKRVTQAALDLSTKTGKDLAVSMNILDKAAQGIVPTFRELRIEIDKNIPSGEVLETVLRKIEERMGGAAQKDIQSFRGQLEQTKNEFDEAKEAAGNALLKIAEFLGILKGIKGISKDIQMALSIPSTNIDKLEKDLWEVEKRLRNIQTLIPTGIPGAYMPAPNMAEEQAFLKQRKEDILKAIELEKNRQEGTIQGNAVEEKRMKKQVEFREKYESMLLKDPKIRLARLQEDYTTYQAAFKDNAESLLEIDKWYKNEKDILDLEILKSAKTHSDLYVQIMQGAAKGMKTAISEGFIKVIKGEFEGLKDVVIDFGNVMLEVLMQAAAAKIIKSTFLAGFLGGHTGGYVMSELDSFGYGRRKFHSGGEVPATLLEGEGVVNRAGMRSLGVDNLNRLNRGEGGGGGGDTINNFYIQAIDVKSFKDRLEQHGDVFSNAAASNVRNNGVLRKANQRFLI